MSETLLLDDPKPCGIGEGAKCCAFLIVGAEGFECGRPLPGLIETVRARLRAGSFTAQYDPGKIPFPECQEKRPR